MKNIEMALAGTENPIQRWTNIVLSLKQAIQDDADILCKVKINEEDNSVFLKLEKYNEKNYFFVFTSEEKGKLNDDITWLGIRDIFCMAHETDSGCGTGFGREGCYHLRNNKESFTIRSDCCCICPDFMDKGRQSPGGVFGAHEYEGGGVFTAVYS